ncbi:iron compound ABC transporter permease FhuG [Brevibacillus agri BAB-2500]|nr:iron compound ABC transporter permease FhuG [Brevibacillus agri BAB-2500]
MKQSGWKMGMIALLLTSAVGCSSAQSPEQATTQQNQTSEHPSQNTSTQAASSEQAAPSVSIDEKKAEELLAQFQNQTPTKVVTISVAITEILHELGIAPVGVPTTSSKLPAALQWMNGSLSGKSTSDVLTILPYSVVGWIAALMCIRQANILRLGEQVAHNLGQNLNRLRFTLSLIAVYLAAISVSTVGLVGFVGLIVPHMSRMLMGSDYRMNLPFGLVLGSLVLLVADTLGRTLFAPLEIPAGIVMAIVGGPYFLYLMRKGGT